MDKTIAKPFLKWAGGKFKLAQEISSHIRFPEGGTYFEPFLGGASVFFLLGPDSAVLSDENERLINTYKSVRRDPAKVHRHLQEIASSHSDENYYYIRGLFNTGDGTKDEQAARFIYLNKAGFNGVYRVNRQGSYNVPAGKRTQLALPTLEDLQRVSEKLKRAGLVHADFELVLGHANAGDVVYLDPPYPPISDSSFFNHYTQDRFSGDEQIRVAEIAKLLKDKGCTVVVSNADTPEIRALYKGWTTISIELRRWITAAKTKHFVKEVLFVSKN